VLANAARVRSTSATSAVMCAYGDELIIDHDTRRWLSVCVTPSSRLLPTQPSRSGAPRRRTVRTDQGRITSKVPEEGLSVDGHRY